MFTAYHDNSHAKPRGRDHIKGCGKAPRENPWASPMAIPMARSTARPTTRPATRPAARTAARPARAPSETRAEISTAWPNGSTVRGGSPAAHTEGWKYVCTLWGGAGCPMGWAHCGVVVPNGNRVPSGVSPWVLPRALPPTYSNRGSCYWHATKK